MVLAFSTYEWFLAIHVLAASLWIGTNFLFHVQFARMDFEADPGGTARLLRDTEWVGNRLLAPLSMVLLIAGFVMLSELDWDFPFWIVFGLVVWAYSFVAGAFYLGRRAVPLAERLESEGYSAVARETRTFTLVARIEMTLLILVILDMTLKPG